MAVPKGFSTSGVASSRDFAVIKQPRKSPTPKIAAAAMVYFAMFMCAFFLSVCVAHITVYAYEIANQQKRSIIFSTKSQKFLTSIFDKSCHYFITHFAVMISRID